MARSSAAGPNTRTVICSQFRTSAQCFFNLDVPFRYERSQGIFGDDRSEAGGQQRRRSRRQAADEAVLELDILQAAVWRPGALDDGVDASDVETLQPPSQHAQPARQPRRRERVDVDRAISLAASSGKHAIGSAEQRRQPHVDEIDVGERQDQVGVEDDAAVQQVVEHVEQRRVGLIDDPRDLAPGRRRRRTGPPRRRRRGSRLGGCSRGMVERRAGLRLTPAPRDCRRSCRPATGRSTSSALRSP